MTEILEDEFLATPEEIERARNEFCLGSNDEIEIDEGARVSRGDDGFWVAAWVWLRYPDTENNQ